MQKPLQETVPPEKKHVIQPASARQTEGKSDAQIMGYAPHTGNARSMEDVTVRQGTAPIIDRGEADDDEIEDVLPDALPASGAPD
jgi:hypothetical protein